MKEMKELMEVIDCIAEAELKRANEKFPQFHSRHEGLGVIAEEVYEFKEEIRLFDKACDGLTTAIFRDFDCEKPLKDAERRMQSALAEGTQVLAMLKKFRVLLESEEKKDEM